MKVFIGCASNDQIDNKYKDMTISLGEKLSNMGFDLIIGGNTAGLMKKLSDIFRNNKRDVVVNSIPKYKEDNVDKINYYDDTFVRSKNNYYMADYILFLPGGIGTISELFSMLEEKRTKNDPKDIIIYNYDNYFSDIVKLITKYITNKFNDIELLNDIRVFNREEDLINYFEEEKKKW